MTRWTGAAWALAALALAEFGARATPLAAGGVLPLALLLVLAAALGVPCPAAGGGGATGIARAAMLPMMATLPAMGVWCSAAGLAPATMALLHVAAMLLPALWLRAPSEAACRALLLAGGAMLLLVPGVQGLMAAALLHAAAAGLACAAGPAPARARGAPLALALVVLAFGLALDRHGPLAAQVLHGALALAALLPARRRAALASTGA